MKRKQSNSDINHINVYLGQSPKAIERKAKINKWDILKPISFYTSVSFPKWDEKIAYILGKNICKRCGQQGLNFQNIQTAQTTQ